MSKSISSLTTKKLWPERTSAEKCAGESRQFAKAGLASREDSSKTARLQAAKPPDIAREANLRY